MDKKLLRSVREYKKQSYLQIPVKRLVDYPPYANVPGW